MDDFESRLKVLENARRELEESFIVMTHLETKQSRMIKEQAEYLAGHETRLREAEQRNAQADQRNREVDLRIEKLVSAIGLILTQRP
jgi:hypothetical protein